MRRFNKKIAELLYTRYKSSCSHAFSFEWGITACNHCIPACAPHSFKLNVIASEARQSRGARPEIVSLQNEAIHTLSTTLTQIVGGAHND